MLFQSTLPRRERLVAVKVWYPMKEFQSTLPRRERQRQYIKDLHPIAFQSTLPRRERPFPRYINNSHTVISIHAPAKGATVDPVDGFCYFWSFQSTLPRRERLMTFSISDSISRFQSTLPRRERQDIPESIRISNVISIHAPAKGATSLKNTTFKVT